MMFRRSGVEKYRSGTHSPSSTPNPTEDTVMNWLTLVPRVDVIDIVEALERNAEVDAKDIHVKVDGDVVRLEGNAHLWRERRIAERAAWSVPGGRKVNDHLLLA
jgi:hypothetical protein